MDPTLDDCNEALDWIEDTFDLGKDFRIRIREVDGVHYIALTCFRGRSPSASEICSPDGWAMEAWTRDEDGYWKSAIYRVREDEER